ncbi:hypothetical protein PCANB_002808 [Pneumocystis canis]|nr:hypothetical protein PCANB_002808 [Pneumocystis canis]
MGKKKIQIKKIENPHIQMTTFSRRRNGLFKKAHELSVLCDIDISILIFDTKNKCHIYCSKIGEEAAQIMMQKYIDKSFKTDTSKRQGNDMSVSKSLSWDNMQESVAVIDMYQVVSVNTKENDVSQTYTSLESVEDIDGTESLCIRSKRIYHVHHLSSETTTTQIVLPTAYLDNTEMFQRDHTTMNTSNCPQSSVLSERRHPYLDSSYAFSKSTPDFRLTTDSNDFYRNELSLNQNNSINHSNQIHKRHSAQLNLDLYSYNMLSPEKYTDQTLPYFEINNNVDSGILNNVIEDYIAFNHTQESHEKTAEKSLCLDNKADYSPSKILPDFQNYLYIYD